ncbi:hypothetical protein OG390_09115 [Streptomyces sp. NBC_00996]|nr:hypothetical protein OG390_09115 [Streptomyces sp. NBC_00996]
MLDKLTAKYGRVLVILDQPASIGAPPLAVARDAGREVAYPHRQGQAAPARRGRGRDPLPLVLRQPEGPRLRSLAVVEGAPVRRRPHHRHPALEAAPEPQGGIVPFLWNGIAFLTTRLDRLIAVDARTGRMPSRSGRRSAPLTPSGLRVSGVSFPGERMAGNCRSS